nr:SIMPL domain-containing protein [Bacteriovorax sp. HI3]
MNSVSSLVVAFGVALGGFFIGNGIIQFKKLDRVVEVKGLSERVVDANEARWSLTYNVASDNMSDLNKKISDTQKTTLAFLEAEGFTKEEIIKDAGNITDKEAQEYGERKGARFVARGGFVVTSTKIDKLVAASQKTDELLSKGVALSGSRVSYYFTALNDIKPQMLEEATKNARAAAQSFAANAGAKVGDIKNASQGLFSIGSPINDYDADSSLKKKVRVVSQVIFYLD